MTHETFQERLAELQAKIETLPEEQQAILMNRVVETESRFKTIRSACMAARAALGDWRIAMKYRIFDAEASYRESQES